MKLKDWKGDGRSSYENDVIEALTQVDPLFLKAFERMVDDLWQGDFYSHKRAGIILKWKGDNPAVLYFTKVEFGEIAGFIIMIQINVETMLLLHFCLGTEEVPQKSIEIATSRAKQFWGVNENIYVNV